MLTGTLSWKTISLELHFVITPAGKLVQDNLCDSSGFSGMQREEKVGVESFFNSEVLYGILSFGSVQLCGREDGYSSGLSDILCFTPLFYIKNSTFEPYAPIRGIQTGMGQLLGYELFNFEINVDDKQLSLIHI